jgi:hypothetical protein
VCVTVSSRETGREWIVELELGVGREEAEVDCRWAAAEERWEWGVELTRVMAEPRDMGSVAEGFWGNVRFRVVEVDLDVDAMVPTLVVRKLFDWYSCGSL